MGACHSKDKGLRVRSILKGPSDPTDEYSDHDDEPDCLKNRHVPRIETEVRRKPDPSFQKTVLHGSTKKNKPKYRRPGRLAPVKYSTQYTPKPSSIVIHSTTPATVPMTPSATDASVPEASVSNFQKLKLQVQVAAKHRKRMHKASKMQDRVNDAAGVSALWDEYETIERSVKKNVVDELPGKKKKSGSSVRSRMSRKSASRSKTSKKKAVVEYDLPQDELPRKKSGSSVRSKHSRKSTRTKSSTKSESIFRRFRKETEPQVVRVRSESFDLQEAKTWYFDFQDTFKKEQDDSDNLSLHSESSMEVQRRLFAEKKRNKKFASQLIYRPSKSVTHSRTTTSRNEDYGPTSTRRCTASTTDEPSLTDMEVAIKNDDDDESYVSDLDDSMSVVSNDYNVVSRRRSSSECDLEPVAAGVEFDHDAVVQRRLEIESQLRALHENVVSKSIMTGDINADESLDPIISAATPNTSTTVQEPQPTPLLDERLLGLPDRQPDNSLLLDSPERSTTSSSKPTTSSPLSDHGRLKEVLCDVGGASELPFDENVVSPIGPRATITPSEERKVADIPAITPYVSTAEDLKIGETPRGLGGGVNLFPPTPATSRDLFAVPYLNNRSGSDSIHIVGLADKDESLLVNQSVDSDTAENEIAVTPKPVLPWRRNKEHNTATPRPSLPWRRNKAESKEPDCDIPIGIRKPQDLNDSLIANQSLENADDSYSKLLLEEETSSIDGGGGGDSTLALADKVEAQLQHVLRRYRTNV